jgi:hypothetical protein
MTELAEEFRGARIFERLNPHPDEILPPEKSST